MKDYLAFVKSRKHTEKKVREAVKKQLSYVRRDIGYLENFFNRGYAPADNKDIPLLVTIFRLYLQQEYMYKNHVHSVEECIVSIREPWIRPIVRGKASAPVEFGPKLDVRIDSEGHGRIEKVSFAPYNENGIRLSGPKLGRPCKDAGAAKKQEHQDNTDWIEVERFFCRSKRCFGMRLIVTKLETTQLTSVALSVFVSNLFRIQRRICAVSRH